jgi:lysophospholipase L1-like esterase
VAAAGLVASGCASSGTSVIPGAEAHVVPSTYVAIGGSESVGFDANDPTRQAFPVLFDHRLPHQTAFYDLAVPGARTADVLALQEPTAVALHPNVVTVWIGVSDVEAGVSPAAFGKMLQDIVAPLRAVHAHVLLANIEPITDAPAYQACAGERAPPPDSNSFRCFVDRRFAAGTLPAVTTTNAVLTAYDSQVAAVARRDGALLVNLGAAMSQAGTATASLFSTDDFDLSTMGQALAARLFIASWRSSQAPAKLK